MQNSAVKKIVEMKLKEEEDKNLEYKKITEKSSSSKNLTKKKVQVLKYCTCYWLHQGNPRINCPEQFKLPKSPKVKKYRFIDRSTTPFPNFPREPKKKLHFCKISTHCQILIPLNK